MPRPPSRNRLLDDLRSPGAALFALGLVLGLATAVYLRAFLWLEVGMGPGFHWMWPQERIWSAFLLERGGLLLLATAAALTWIGWRRIPRG